MFAVMNSDAVTINLFFYKFVASKALLIFVSAALGAIIGTTLGLIRYMKLIKEVKNLRKENGEFKSRIESIEIREQNLENQNIESIENIGNVETIEENIDKIESVDRLIDIN
jgi:glycerol uptake facilitator-like aquaporin